ncbi:rhomboid family intramembrane serine protease [Phormidium sp. CCY1219]|uniref:rhomboid family intramembrane serine protease n=1 Tax=Phormidium sp. CCY1219 TaxID=2886104 RepID=UPI002D1F4902|nr:rhomboid family intramembrane serine protease [Phormidium sp. CCY1219]MEB3828334.1 rhomboid family intramembrane serine protease [Phormidium sp. CCY1219]
MIPIDDNIPTRTRPLVTSALIGLNVALFILEIKLDLAGELTDFLQTWSVVPDRILAVVTDAIAHQNPAAWVTLIFMSATSFVLGMFLHGSISQILGNLLFLWVFGKRVEQILGHGRFLIFYLLCGILSAIAQVAIAPDLTVPLVGANGAIAAILGAYFLNFPKAKIDTILPLIILFIPIELPISFYLLWWFVQQLFYGIGKLAVIGGVNPFSIGYWAHGVGLIIGAGLVPFFVKYKPNRAIY